MDPRPAQDATRVRELHARNIEIDDFIGREVAMRLGERLDLIRIDPLRVLDAGCGRGADLGPLAQRYRGAQIVGLDLAWQRLAAQRSARRRESAGVPSRGLVARLAERLRIAPGDAAAKGSMAAEPWLVCGDLAQLPLADASMDLVWSCLALPWIADAARVFHEWQRITRPGGVVLFAAFGPDTLKEVRQAFASVDALPHALEFTDMHDYGDMMVQAGLADPVVDAERLRLTYANADAFWRDVRSLGGNSLVERRRTLMGRGARRRLDAALEASRGADGMIGLTLEVITGHAWHGQGRRRPTDPQPVRFVSQRHNLPRP